MARFFRLGVNWFPCFAWLVGVSTGLADFGSADSNALSDINNYTRQIKQTLQYLTDANSGYELSVVDSGANYKLSQILAELQSYTSIDYTTILNSIDSTLTDSKGTIEDIYSVLSRLEIPDYTDILESIDGTTTDIKASLDGLAEAFDSYVESCLDYFSDFDIFSANFDTFSANFDDLSLNVSTYIDDQETRYDEFTQMFGDALGGVTNSINTWGLSVSNAIANNIGTVPAIYTNFPALFAYMDDDEDNHRYLLWSLLGYEPSDDEADYFYYAYQRGGLGRWVAYLLQYFIDTNALSDDLYDYFDSSIPYSVYDNNPYPLTYDYMDSFASSLYYEYGTRPLIDYFDQATNDYVLANHKAVTVNDDGDASFSDKFVSSVGSLASSFAPSVNTNIATVVTNDIVDIEDDSYSSKYDEIIEYDPADNGTDDILSYVNDTSLIDDFTSQLSGSGEVSFSFDLPALTGTENIVIKVDDVTSYTGSYFEVMFGFLKFVVFSVMAYKCWSIVVDVNFQKFR